MYLPESKRDRYLVEKRLQTEISHMAAEAIGQGGPLPTFYLLWPKKSHRGGNGEEMPAQFSDASAAYEFHRVLPL